VNEDALKELFDACVKENEDWDYCHHEFLFSSGKLFKCIHCKIPIQRHFAMKKAHRVLQLRGLTQRAENK